ncbi:MAG: hypothetical protein L0H88_08955 [Propionibacterium sp.]|nr:hypothetical protein [Propionibacterium sp.]
MSELDIEEIRERVAQATPAPWSSYVLPQQVGLNRASLHSPNGPQETVWTTNLDPEIGGVGTIPDAELIAHAPADLTALCDEVEHLRAERDLMREAISLSLMKATKLRAEAVGDLEAASSVRAWNADGQVIL